jgi:phosphonate transport system substrate-binding protein
MRIPLLIAAAAAIAVVAVFLVFSQRGEDVQRLDLTERTNTPVAHGYQDGEKNVLTFGFDLRSSPEEDARQYLPFFAYLEHETGLHFRLRFTPQANRLSDELAEGHVDLAAVGAVSYIRALEGGGAVPLVRGLNSEGKASYTSVIVVAPNGGIAALDDLRGMRFAFGGEDSTQGHLIPRIVLNEAGIALTDLASHEFTG